MMSLSGLLTRSVSLHELQRCNWLGSPSADSWASCSHQHIWAKSLGQLPSAVGWEPSTEPWWVALRHEQHLSSFVRICRPLRATWPRHRLGGLVSPALLGLPLSPALSGRTSDKGGKGGSQDPREGGSISPRTQTSGLGRSALSCSPVLLASPPAAHGRSGGSGKGEIRRAWGAAGAANRTLQPPVSSPSHAEMSHAEKGTLTLWPRHGLALGPASTGPGTTQPSLSRRPAGGQVMALESDLGLNPDASPLVLLYFWLN